MKCETREDGAREGRGKWDALVLTDGDFPRGAEALAVLEGGAPVVCCDAAVRKLEAAWGEGKVRARVAAVTGDGDSLPPAEKARWGGLWREEREQETNDLAKALRYCEGRGWRRVVVLGAMGGREDHALGNLGEAGAAAERGMEVEVWTDTGRFSWGTGEREWGAFAGQQVSIFAASGRPEVESEGLKWALGGRVLERWRDGSLNEATGAAFKLRVRGGWVAVFRTWEGGVRAQG